MLKINEITRLYLGIQGENKARTLTIDVSAWIALYPNGSVTIWHKRNGESEPTATGAVYDSETQTVTWEPTSTDTYYDGEGEAEIRLTESEVIKKSKTVITGVSPAVTLAGTTLGSDWQSYINAVDGLRAAAVTAKEAAEDAEEDAEDSAEDAEAYAIGKRGGTDVESTDPAYHNNSKYWSDKANEMLNVTDVAGAQATTLSAGSSATAEFETGESGKVLKLGIPKGDKGDTGNTGPTPVISIGTVTTGDAGTSASASMDTTDPAHPVLSFTIPKGAKGDSGDGDMLAAAFAEATANDAGTYVTYDGGLYYLPEGHTANVTWANTTKTQVKIGGEVTALKSAIQQMPDIKDSTKSGVDLDIADDDGNVVARFSEGHFQTKHFDSRNVVDCKPIIETFTKTGNYTRGTALTLEIDKRFSKGDRLVFHLDDGNKNYEAGNRATYYEGSTAFLSSYKGSNGYVEHIVTDDNVKVSIRIGGSEYSGDKSNLKLYVYRINGEIKPKIVTVAADGSGMFTSLRDAVDSITDANAYTNPYVIQIYPGTYDIMSYYTDEEIADVVVPYTQTSYVGLKLTDGISLVGVGGTRDEIILTATLDTGTWSSDVRGQVSTLNLQGSNSLENLTILAYNIRYCVHDDFNCPAGQITFRKLKNLKFGGSLTNTAKFTTYGAGMARPRNYLIEDCDFGYTIGIHGSTVFSQECQVIMRNCSGYAFFIGDYADGESDAFANYEIDNCNFERIYINHHYPSIPPHIRLYGVGNEQTMVSCDNEYVFDFGNILKIEPGFTAGTVVRHTASSDMFEATDSIDTYCGIVINADNNNSYVQRSGFINSNFLGLSSLSIGDYVTVDGTTKKVVSGGTASNAIGVVVATESDGTAFIRMRK